MVTETERQWTWPSWQPVADPGAEGGRRLAVTLLPGRIPYLPMLARQQALATARERNEIGGLLLLLEHDHVYTNGRGGNGAHFLADAATLTRLGAAYQEVDRGGAITYHGPGQLVGYPIVDLQGAAAASGITCTACGRPSSRPQHALGLKRPTCGDTRASGSATRSWPRSGSRLAGALRITVFALNVCPDLAYFGHIVPCGIQDRGVTSLTRLPGRAVSLEEVARVCADAFADVFGLELEWSAPSPP